MERMTIQEIAEAIGSTERFEGAVEQVSTDSRALPEGCLFLALAGERFNGHDYLAAAQQNGAAFAVAQERRADYAAQNGRILYVQDTGRALLELGRAYRGKFSIHCVGVTGSVGKTTTKEMIAQVVSAGYKTLKTEGNLNNEIGLPKTLFGLDRSHQAAVIEMGMEGLGEIATLAAVAQPQIGVITNVGVSHIERLGSRENILKAKMELADALPDGAPLLLCGDNDLLSGVQMPRLRVTFFGIENPGCAVLAEEIFEQAGETRFTLRHPDGRIPVHLPCMGRHNVLNALAAFAVGRELGISPEDCAQALAGYRPSGMRQKVVDWNGVTVVEDCYNASPDSMRAALSTLGRWEGASRRIAVLADMLELGEISRMSHIEAGQCAAEQGIDLLLAYGEQGRYYVEGAFGVDARWFETKDALCKALEQESIPGSVIWVKASRGMKLEEVLEQFYSRTSNP